MLRIVQNANRRKPWKKVAGVIAVIFLFQLGVAAQGPLERLQSKVEVAALGEMTPAQLAGKYSNPTKRFQFGLTGNDLYLFADGTYIYDEWGDVEPRVIRDKGTWRVADAFVNLKSDSKITWDPDVERKYIVVHRLSRPNEILLVGTSRNLSHFEENSKNDPETELMIICKERLRTITGKQTIKIKEQLMRESWRPEYFRKASR
jgi:hypothetical protein